MGFGQRPDPSWQQTLLGNFVPTLTGCVFTQPCCPFHPVSLPYCGSSRPISVATSCLQMTTGGDPFMHSSEISFLKQESVNPSVLERTKMG